MSKVILAKKRGMTQVFDDDGHAVPVTVLEAGPCTVLQLRTLERDGYSAVQLGFDPVDPETLSRPLQGHMSDMGAFRTVREFRLDDAVVDGGDDSGFQPGDTINVDQFEPGDRVDVRGTTKGRGFQGVVKRHGFSGGPASHGHRHVLRAPGSIGGAYPQRVFKGMKMAGRMGDRKTTTRNLTVMRVDPESHVLAVKGAVPGSVGSVIEIRATS